TSPSIGPETAPEATPNSRPASVFEQFDPDKSIVSDIYLAYLVCLHNFQVTRNMTLGHNLITLCQLWWVSDAFTRITCQEPVDSPRLYYLKFLQPILQNVLTMLRISTNIWEPNELQDVEEGLVLQATIGSGPPGANLITSKMNSESIAACLIQHGCNDITGSLELHCCHTLPLARGGLGAVYLGALKDGRPVAIKCVELFNGHDINVSEHGKCLKRAAREIYTWSHCNHRGVLPMLGFAHFRGQIALVTPWMKAG
ncbi:unnamed protein product, partial [Rhizoctonia solani]